MIRQRPSRGFTQIELTIVMGIIMIIAGTPFMLITRMDEHRMLLEDRMQASEEALAALRAWRADIERSISIEASPEEARMTMRLLEDQSPVSVVYAMTSSGDLTRTVSGSGELPREIAHGIDSLRFERSGGSWRMAWQVEWTDGSSEFTWKFGGWAAPLLPPKQPGDVEAGANP